MRLGRFYANCEKMLANSCFALTGAIAISAISPPQASRAESPSLDNLVQQAASKDQTIFQQAIANLRELKNVGVHTFWNAYQKDLANNSPNSPNLRATLDAICQQKDCDASRLYWYKDLDAAKISFKETGKPILSLRLLGNLNDELSCANSRFFRTAFYSSYIH